VYSDVPVYAETIRHLATGYLTPNAMEAWVEALETLIADEAMRRRLAENAHEFVWSHRTLRQCAERWTEAFIELEE